MPDLLIELLSEEIPARMQRRASLDFEKLLTDGISELGLSYESSAAFTTPRRLVLVLENVSSKSLSRSEEKRGPRTDAPEKAVQGFLKSTGFDLSQLEVRQEKKGEFYYATFQTKGREAADVISVVLEKIIRNFPWPKSMRWGETSLKWVRPLHSIICILYDDDGSKIVDMNIEGISSGDKTYGHRFMGSGEFSVTSFEDYAARLKKNYVVLDPSERAEIILQEMKNQAFAQGLELINDLSLLNEVVGLIEWPVVLLGKLEDEFLSLPAEVLQTSMREHQKFFSIRNPKDNKVVQFATVANRETADGGSTILAGNQKVLSARLSDAKFFWDNDLRTIKTGGLDIWLEKLKKVTFHNKLGSQFERVERIINLSEIIAKKIGCDPKLAKDAAYISKADLSSEMVYEFPELQGIMGSYYAISQSIPLSQALAIRDHYLPKGIEDKLPETAEGIAVSMADKIDTLVGFFGLDIKPTGSKDPFALRRAALAILRMIDERSISIPLDKIFQKAAHLYSFKKCDDELALFITERLKVKLRDKGISHDIVSAAIIDGEIENLHRQIEKVKAIDKMLNTPLGIKLLEGYKRAANLLSAETKQEKVKVQQAKSFLELVHDAGVDKNLLKLPAERELFQALLALPDEIGETQNLISQTIERFSFLNEPITAFFETVKVNDDDSEMRGNRLKLLSLVCKKIELIADFKKIER